MMPDLGSYGPYVLSAYGASVALIVLLVAQSIWRSRRVKRELGKVEARRKPRG